MTFEEVYQLFYPRVFRLCMGYVADEEQAKDMVQEIFITIWKALPGFRGASSIDTWVYRIATNQCLRTVARGQRTVHENLPEQMEDVPVFNKEEKLQVLYRCISMLKENERIMISLVLEGLPGAEIAAITGVSEGTVRVKIYRIKEKLAQLFKTYEHV